MKYSLIAVLLAACGDNPTTPDAAGNAPAVVHGDLAGAPFTPRDAIWTNASANGFDFSDMSTVLIVTDFPDACAKQASNTGVPNGRLLIFVLASDNGTSSPISAPGTYDVFKGTPPHPGLLVETDFEVDGPNCLKSQMEFGASGTVAVTSATDPQTATFDVTFDNGDHITGSYRATSCPALDPNRTPTGGC